MQARRVLLLATSFVLALAVWVSRGALAVTDAASWPTRVGILPSRWAPPVLALVFLVALWRARRSTLLVLLIPGVLLLPWLPVPVPAAALLWTGRVVAWVWIADRARGSRRGVAALVWCQGGGLAPRSAHGFAGRARPRVHPLLFGRLAGGGDAARRRRAALPGDHPEPARVTATFRSRTTTSSGDYSRYFAGELKPDFLRRGKNGEIYSIHAPGLPALVLPAFAVAGYRGVIAFLALLSALRHVAGVACRVPRDAQRGRRLVRLGERGRVGAVLHPRVHRVPRCDRRDHRHGGRRGAGRVRDGDEDGRADTVPAAAGWGAARWALLGGALAFLPWLHTRYAGAAAVVGTLLALRLLAAASFGRLAAFVSACRFSAPSAWFGYFYAIYGEFSPAAPYGHYTQSSWANIPRGLPALLFDQQFGILPNAPVYAFGLIGLVSLFRTKRRLALELALLLASYLLLVSAYYMWWGGWSAPARFAVPVLLMLGLPAAVFWSRQRTAGKAMALAALGVTVLVTASLTTADSGRLIFNNRDGVALWLEWLTPVVDLPRAFPSFLQGHDGNRVDAGGNLGGLSRQPGPPSIRAMVRRSGPRAEDGAAESALRTLLVLAVAVMLAASATWGTSRVGGATPTTSALALLRSYDPAARPVGVRFLPFGRLSIDQVPAAPAHCPSSNRRPRSGRRSAADALRRSGRRLPLVCGDGAGSAGHASR